MKFFEKLRRGSAGNVLQADQEENLINNNGGGLDRNGVVEYFSEQGTLSRMIIQGQEQFLKNMTERQVQWNDTTTDTTTTTNFDERINDQFINDRALKKYGTERHDFLPEGAQWFPRMRSNQRGGNHDDSDADSLNSFSSDFSHDGFAGPFSWETRSLQEMEFPPTPVGERKLSPSPAKNTKKKLKKMSSTDLDGVENNSHRNYETIEQLRGRLKQNYVEAKRQREKYLNLSPSRLKDAGKSLNGHRSKTQQQPVFKNYKQKSEKKPKTNGVVTFHNEQDLVRSYSGDNTSASDDIANQLNITVGGDSPSNSSNSEPNYSTREIITTTYLGSPTTSPTKSNLRNGSKYVVNSNATTTSNNNKKQSNNVNATKYKSNNTEYSFSETSGNRKNNSKLPEINHNDVEGVLQNQNIDEEPGKGRQSMGDKEQSYSNMMDVLTNW